MLSVYLDDSGSHDESTVCVLAGAVSPPDRWERLTRLWVSVLAAFGVTDFHASDCANGGGSFRGWAADRRYDLYGRLARITRRHVAFRTWVAVFMDDYRANFLREKRESLPISICAMGCASRLRPLALGRDIYIPYVFDHAPKAGRIYRVFEDLIRQGKRDFYRMGMLSKGVRVASPPLQAADLIAYETHRYFSDQLAGHRHRRSAFEEILHIKDIGGDFMGAEKLGMLVRGIRERPSERELIAIPADYLTPENCLRVERISSPPSRTPATPGE